MFYWRRGFYLIVFFSLNEIRLTSIMYYYLGSSLGFFLHWIYQLNEVFEQFTNLMIDENEFQNLCRRVSLTKSDFMRM